MSRFSNEPARRRRVFRSLGLYIGFSWLTIQAASVLLGAFEAPVWILRSLVVVGVAASPIVAAVAWITGAAGPAAETAPEPGDARAGALGWRKLDFVVIGILTIALILSVSVNFSGVSTPPDIRPVTALIADFENRTGEAVFDGVLEQLLMLGLEAAPFVALFDRSQARDLARDLDAGVDELPLTMARLVAVRQAVAVVLEGSVERAAAGYRLRVAGLEPVTGDKEFELSREVAERDRVPEAMAALARAAREELQGPGLREADRPFTERGEGYAVTSLEAAKLYADANRLNTEGDFVAAADLYRQAAELEPNWPAVHGGWAIVEFNRGRIDEAERLFDRTLSLVGESSEMERLFYLSTYFLMIREDYDNALETMAEYVALAPASSAGRNNLAVTAFYTLDFDRAKQEGRQLVDVFPNHSLYRTNLALYSMYAGDFDTAESEARRVLENDPAYGSAYLPLAISALEEHDPDRALELYRRMAETDAGVREGGAEAVATAGIVDTRLYLGLFAEARELLLALMDRSTEPGTAVPALRRIQLAESYSASGDRESAIAAAREALALSEQTSISVAAALVLTSAGELEAAETITDDLSNRLAAHGRAYGRMLRGAVLRARGRYAEASDLLESALGLADLWRIRFELGRTYLEAGRHADALAEFERCRERRGEAAALFLDDVPTYRYLAELPYWTARAQTGLGMDEAAARNYSAFLALRPEGGAYVDDARAQLAR